MGKIKIIRVTLCGDDDNVTYTCPFFKRKKHYDYSDECRCMLYEKFYDGRFIPQFKSDEDEDEISSLVPDEYGYIGGQFPDWCPLDDDVGV